MHDYDYYELYAPVLQLSVFQFLQTQLNRFPDLPDVRQTCLETGTTGISQKKHQDLTSGSLKLI